MPVMKFIRLRDELCKVRVKASRTPTSTDMGYVVSSEREETISIKLMLPESRVSISILIILLDSIESSSNT